MFHFFKKKEIFDYLGKGFKGGDKHYRAYVGPPHYYDVISSMVFNLLTCAGLRQHHRVLDIGCGSLRVGRLLIPLLNRGNYYGVEPNKWLIKDGIANEIGKSQIKIKKPVFIYASSLKGVKKSLQIDYAVAQSVFSHCSRKMIADWLKQTSFHLQDSGALFATFFADSKDYQGEGWIYPDCSRFKIETMHEIAEQAGLTMHLIQWEHPRQQSWAVFAKPEFKAGLISAPGISWNHFVTTAIDEG